MADGINIKLLPSLSSIKANDLLLVEDDILGTHTIAFSSMVLSANQVSFYSDLSSRINDLEISTTTFISGGISPSGSIVPDKVGVMYFAADTQDYFLSVGNINNTDWKRILTVNY